MPSSHCRTGQACRLGTPSWHVSLLSLLWHGVAYRVTTGEAALALCMWAAVAIQCQWRKAFVNYKTSSTELAPQHQNMACICTSCLQQFQDQHLHYSWPLPKELQMASTKTRAARSTSTCTGRLHRAPLAAHSHWSGQCLHHQASVLPGHTNYIAIHTIAQHDVCSGHANIPYCGRDIR
jgi:hypothetical protein